MLKMVAFSFGYCSAAAWDRTSFSYITSVVALHFPMNPAVLLTMPQRIMYRFPFSPTCFFFLISRRERRNGIGEAWKIFIIKNKQKRKQKGRNRKIDRKPKEEKSLIAVYGMRVQ